MGRPRSRLIFAALGFATATLISRDSHAFLSFTTGELISELFDFAAVGGLRSETLTPDSVNLDYQRAYGSRYGGLIQLWTGTTHAWFGPHVRDRSLWLRTGALWSDRTLSATPTALSNSKLHYEMSSFEVPLNLVVGLIESEDDLEMELYLFGGITFSKLISKTC